MERVELTRRDFLRRAIALGGPAVLFVGLSGCVYDEYHVDPVKNLKPGEWVSHESYTIRIANNGDPGVKMVNIRSTWNIRPTETNPTRVETLVGMVAVGSVLEAVGQIKGEAGYPVSEVFFVAKGGEFLRLQGAGKVELNPNFDRAIDPEGAYFVNKSYTEIVGIKP